MSLSSVEQKTQPRSQSMKYEEDVSKEDKHIATDDDKYTSKDASKDASKETSKEISKETKETDNKLCSLSEPEPAVSAPPDDDGLHIATEILNRIKILELDIKNLKESENPSKESFNRYNKWQQCLDKYIKPSATDKPNGWRFEYIGMIVALVFIVVGLIVSFPFVKKVESKSIQACIYSVQTLSIVACLIYMQRVYSLAASTGTSYYGIKMTTILAVTIFCLVLCVCTFVGLARVSSEQHNQFNILRDLLLNGGQD